MYYANDVSSDLQSRLVMKQNQLNKEVCMLTKEKQKLQDDWVQLKYHMAHSKDLCKDQEQQTRGLQDQQQQVGIGRCLAV